MGRRDRIEHDPHVPLVGEDPEARVRSRTSLKRERVEGEKALARLAADLVPLDEGRWSALGVPELTRDALRDAQKIKSAAALARQLRKVRATLRDADWVLLRQRMDTLRAGFSPGSGPAEGTSKRARDWSEQLLIGGTPALTRFLDEYPKADGQRLRQLIKSTNQAPGNKRGKARIQLDRAVQHEVGE